MSEQTNNSILLTIRGMIGPSVEYDVFDSQLIVHINSAFSRLCQLGVGPMTPFTINGPDQLWCDFVAPGYQEEIKQYIYLSVKLIFDPPPSSTVLNVYQKQLETLEWLLKEVAVDGY